MTADLQMAAIRAVARDLVEQGALLSIECRRTGDWMEAAVWLALSLNAIDSGASAYRTFDLGMRTGRDELVGKHVATVDGDHRDPDLIRLPDGTRVCWHLGRRRQETGWVVERSWERCAFAAGR